MKRAPTGRSNREAEFRGARPLTGTGFNDRQPARAALAQDLLGDDQQLRLRMIRSHVVGDVDVGPNQGHPFDPAEPEVARQNESDHLGSVSTREETKRSQLAIPTAGSPAKVEPGHGMENPTQTGDVEPSPPQAISLALPCRPLKLKLCVGFGIGFSSTGAFSEAGVSIDS